MSGAYIYGLDLSRYGETFAVPVLLRKDKSGEIRLEGSYSDDFGAYKVIPVTDHGRLIDADELHESIKKERFSKDALFFSVDHEDRIEKQAFNRGIVRAMICCNNAQAIVPVSKEDTP